MKLHLSILSLFPLLLVHNVLSKPAELLDLYFDLAPAGANGSSTKVEARSEEAEEGKQDAASLTLNSLLETFSTSTLNNALSTNGLSNLVSQRFIKPIFTGATFF